MLCLLIGYYVYAEYDRNRGEQISKEMLSNMVLADNKSGVFSYDDTTIKVKDDKIVVIVDTEDEKSTAVNIGKLQSQVENNKNSVLDKNTSVASDGTVYSRIAIINIPSIKLTYPVLSTYNTELLKISPCKYWGCDPNEVGNFCIRNFLVKFLI